MNYKAIKIKSCPFCHKKGMTYLIDNTCSNCGKNMLNHCVEETCGKPLDGSARYCKVCGKKSVYFSLGLLAHWHEEYDELV